jgi:thymidylate synthase ThyX
MKCEIIADSINPKGKRLTTYVLEYQRFVHAEMLTHRVFSKNAASSRAIPIEKMIQQVIDNPAMPVWWGKNQSGMFAKEELQPNTNVSFRAWGKVHSIDEDGNSGSTYHSHMGDLEFSKQIWLEARDSAITYVRQLAEIGLHKQIANRILEPWFNIRIILSGTEFENFFALRAHPDAQPEIQALAYKMLEEYNKSEPKKLNAGEWHIPFGDSIDIRRLIDETLVAKHGEKWWEKMDGDVITDEAMRKIAIARCARISYFNYEGKDDYAADIILCDRLFGSIPRHLSPTEHVAQAQDDDKFIGNFAGFKQYRYMFDDQNLKDSRVINKNEN